MLKKTWSTAGWDVVILPCTYFMGMTHDLAYPLDDQRDDFRWIITNLLYGMTHNLIRIWIPILILILNLIRSRYHLLLSFCYCPDDHYCWRWCPHILSLKRKNILLAGIVNPANFKSKGVYSPFKQWRDTEQSINQTYNVLGNIWSHQWTGGVLSFFDLKEDVKQ